MRRASLVGLLWRWHRRAGLAAGLLLVFLALSGLLLNHADGLGLATWRVQSGWVRALYRDAPVPVQAWRAGGRWIAQAADGELLLDAAPAGACEGRLIGALERRGMLVVACENALVLLTPEGERIDAMGRSAGLDRSLSGLGTGPGGVQVQSGGRWFLLDLDTLAPGEAVPAGEIALPGIPPPALSGRIAAAAGWLTWERALLDLHSGRVFGRFGILLMDLAAVLAIALSMSGTLTWALRRRARRKENRHG